MSHLIGGFREAQPVCPHLHPLPGPAIFSISRSFLEKLTNSYFGIPLDVCTLSYGESCILPVGTCTICKTFIFTLYKSFLPLIPLFWTSCDISSGFKSCFVDSLHRLQYKKITYITSVLDSGNLFSGFKNYFLDI